jgi:hypothetical protein
MSEYTVVGDSVFTAFVAAVKRHLADGWKCQGGMSAFFKPNGGGGTVVYSQAMTRPLVVPDGPPRVIDTPAWTVTSLPFGCYTGAGETPCPDLRADHETRPGGAQCAPCPPTCAERLVKAEHAVAAHSTAINGLHEEVAKLKRFQGQVKSALTGG